MSITSLLAQAVELSGRGVRASLSLACSSRVFSPLCSYLYRHMFTA